MKSTLNFLKKNWLLIGLIILALWVWKSKSTDFRGYKGEISRLSDSLAKKDSEYNLLVDRLSASLKLTRNALYDAAMYEDSLNMLRETMRIKTYYYEAEIANLKFVPIDTIYNDVTEWLDGLSFQW